MFRYLEISVSDRYGQKALSHFNWEKSFLQFVYKNYPGISGLGSASFPRQREGWVFYGVRIALWRRYP